MTGSKDTSIENLEPRIAAVISRVVGFAIDCDDDNLESLSIDSLSRLEILALLEKEFSVELTEDLVADFQSISRAARIIRQSMSVSRGGGVHPRGHGNPGLQ
jgi:acyl carrier protein